MMRLSTHELWRFSIQTPVAPAANPRWPCEPHTLLPAMMDIKTIENEVATVLVYWDHKPATWQLVGLLSAVHGASVLPVVEILHARYVIRRQSMELTERDIACRHAFMRHLTNQELPVPHLSERPDGDSYAVVPILPYPDERSYSLDTGIYELQEFVTGQPFTSDGPCNDMYLEAAAATLGALHRASTTFQWPPHLWPPDWSPLGIAERALSKVHDAGKSEGISPSIGAALVRMARLGTPRVHAAAHALEQHQGLPKLHLHGDYQPHHLAFEAGHIAALHDFDAMHWDWRILELAYSLMCFAGVRWDEVSPVTPPLVEQGIDVDRAHAFLSTYGREAPPVAGEAALLADALALAMPIVFVNGIAEDLVFPNARGQPRRPKECRLHLQWAETFLPWLDEHRADLATAWKAS